MLPKNLVCQFNLIDGGYCHNLILSVGRKGSHHLHFSSVFQRKYPVSIAYTKKNMIFFIAIFRKSSYIGTHVETNIYLWWNKHNFLIVKQIIFEILWATIYFRITQDNIFMVYSLFCNKNFLCRIFWRYSVFRWILLFFL